MKPFLIIFLIILSSGSSICQENQGKTYFPPEFVYGNNELDSFVVDNLTKIRDIEVNGMQLTTNVSFMVNIDGSISDIFIDQEVKLEDFGVYMTKDFHQVKERNKEIKEYFRNEIHRIINFSSGLWIPAELNGTLIQEKINKEIVYESDSHKDQSKYIGLGNNKGAVRGYGEFDVLDHNSPIRHHNVGVKKLNQGKFFIACKYFKEAIRLDNSYVDAFYNLGIANLQLEDFEEACRAWNYAQRLGDEGVAELIERYCDK